MGNISEKILYFCSKRINYPLCPPRNITLTLNYICNQNCIMCDIKNHKFDKKYEISFEEVKKIIDEMKDLNIPDLVLTGGEPFLYKDIFKVIDYAKYRERKVIMITNGFYDSRIVNEIIKSEIDHIQVSLDGSTKEIYESIRGVEGSFEVVINNIKRLVENNKSVGATVTVIQQNYKDLLNIAYLAKELECTALALRPAHISNADPLSKDFLGSGVWIPREKLDLLREMVKKLKIFNAETNYLDFSPGLDLLVDYFENGYIRTLNSCFIGFTRLIISYNEKDSYEVWMCGGMVGDIRKKSLKDIWYGKEAYNLRRKIKKCKRRCLFPELHEPELENVFTLCRAIKAAKQR